MIKQRKGITPVIAIVLLLLVTVGAVGVVYTQFQNIADQGSTEATFLDEVNVKIIGVQRNTTGNDTMSISLENTGTDEYSMDNISRLEYSIPGEQTIRPVSGQDLFNQFAYNDSVAGHCLSTSDLEAFGPGDVTSCDTGVEMPSPSEEITIQLTKTATESNAVIDDYDCSPSTSESVTC